MSNPFPRIRVEVEGLSHGIVAAFNERIGQTNNIIQEQLAEALKPENIVAEIQVQVNAGVKYALKNAISDFFSHGEGRAAIREAVYKELSARLRAGEFNLPGDKE